MVNTTVGRFRIFTLVAAVGFSVQLGRAGIVACGSGDAANLGNAAATGINGTTAAGNTPGHGCVQADLGFNNFVVTPTVGTADLAGPAAANIDPSASGGTITGGNTISNIALTLAGAFTTTAHSGAHTLDETVSFQTVPNTGGVAQEPTTPAGDAWALKGAAALSAAGIAVTGGNGIPTGANAPTITITEQICIGQSALVNCAAGNEATVTLLITYTGNGTTLTTTSSTSSSCTGVSVGFGCVASGGGITFNPTQTAFIIDTIAISHLADTGGNTYSIGFTSLTDTFLQGEVAPEPSTVVLLGSALACLGILRMRKRKQA